MKRIAITLALAAAVPPAAWAQMTPVGLWRHLDDQTHQALAEIRIVAKAEGALYGKVERALVNDGEPICTLCTDERKNQPKVGMEIIRGAKQSGTEPLWDGGKILDPEVGKEYRLTLRPIDGGKTLQVRGYLGPFYRTQLWQRIE